MIYLKKSAIIFAIFILLLFPVARSEDILEIEKKTVALTFDDGPSDYTNDILDLLDKHGAYATFFVIGNKALIYKETIMNIVAKGNEIGNHTYSHPWFRITSYNVCYTKLLRLPLPEFYRQNRCRGYTQVRPRFHLRA